MMKKFSYILKSGLSVMMNGSQWTALDFDPHKIQSHSKFPRIQVTAVFIEWHGGCVDSFDRKS
jgi:hypothetical protein